ncbi:MAG: hypothetical protein Q9217_001684 [Psora testacea]
MSNNGNDHALADITNQLASAQIKNKADSVKRVREGGWVEPTEFDYAAYNASTKEEREAVEGPNWASNATKYEWKDEYGDVAPEHAELEKMLFGDENQMKKGTEYDKYLTCYLSFYHTSHTNRQKRLAAINVTIESKTRIQPVTKFEDAGLHPVMLRNIELCGYEAPTPIQAYVLPSILKNTDVIGIAQTGSGKTAAYLIPVLSKLMGKAKKLRAPRPQLTRPWTRQDSVRGEPLVLIVAPTRELATQIFDECRHQQLDELRKGCDILVGTPGRLVHFIKAGHSLTLRRVRYTIIDEADEMVSSNWAEEMNTILGGDSNDDDDHVYMMFSATFPKEARAVARTYMAAQHVRIRVGRAGSSHKNITQRMVFVDEPKKRDCLFDLLLSMPPARTIIFVNNTMAADFLDDFLYNRGLPSTSIHSRRTQREREDALRAFKTGKAPILIATGVSARGLDIKNVMHVINYDLPSSDHGGINEYVHRIGRTARIGNVGMATSFYNDKNQDIAADIVKILVEMDQEVPDFLEPYKPAEGEEITFDDHTDNEGEEGEVNSVEGTSEKTTGDAWGAEASSGAGWG